MLGAALLLPLSLTGDPPIIHLQPSSIAIGDPPIGSTVLAHNVFLLDLMSRDEAQEMRDTVLAAKAYPCPLQETAWPQKRCTKIALPTFLETRLADSWPSLDRTSLSAIAASIDLPSDDHAMRHHFHRDVFPERAPGHAGPSATAVLYLTEAPSDHPDELAAPTIFPRHGLRVRPKAGSLLTWTNVREDGTADPDAEHGVGPYVGADLPPRIALHIPVSDDGAAQAEHVGCGGFDRRTLIWDRAEGFARWYRLTRRLLSHWEEATLRKLRAAGRVAGVFMRLHQQSVERLYAPGGAGYQAAHDEFDLLATAQGPAVPIEVSHERFHALGLPPELLPEPHADFIQPSTPTATPSPLEELAASDGTSTTVSRLVAAALSTGLAAVALALKKRKIKAPPPEEPRETTRPEPEVNSVRSAAVRSHAAQAVQERVCAVQALQERTRAVKAVRARLQEVERRADDGSVGRGSKVLRPVSVSREALARMCRNNCVASTSWRYMVTVLDEAAQRKVPWLGLGSKAALVVDEDELIHAVTTASIAKGMLRGYPWRHHGMIDFEP